MERERVFVEMCGRRSGEEAAVEKREATGEKREAAGEGEKRETAGEGKEGDVYSKGKDGVDEEGVGTRGMGPRHSLTVAAHRRTDRAGIVDDDRNLGRALGDKRRARISDPDLACNKSRSKSMGILRKLSM